MLYLHCGWQRTGTSSLQAALSEHGERLAAEGIIYPAHWRPRQSDGHHGIVDLLASGPSGRRAVERFQGYLRKNADRTILISSESLTNYLPKQRRSMLLKILRAAQAVTPATCLWTLRSMDSLLTSLYLHRLATGRPLPSPEEFFEGFAGWLADAAMTMRAAEEAVDGGAAYWPYDERGSHQAAILGQVGVIDPLGHEIVEAMRNGRRLNARLTHKGAVVLLHTEAVEASVGRRLPRAALRGALRTGELHFAHDARSFELVRPEARQAVHEAMLRGSRLAGFGPYLDFYGQYRVARVAAVSLDPKTLSRADIDLLGTWARSCEPAGAR